MQKSRRNTNLGFSPHSTLVGLTRCSVLVLSLSSVSLYAPAGGVGGAPCVALCYPLCGLSPPDTAPASLLLSLLSPSLLSLPLVTLLLLLRTKPPLLLLLLLLLLLPSSLFAASTPPGTAVGCAVIVVNRLPKKARMCVSGKCTCVVLPPYTKCHPPPRRPGWRE